MRMRIATMLLVPALLAVGHDWAAAQGTTTSGAFGSRTLGGGAVSAPRSSSGAGVATGSQLGGVGANGSTASAPNAAGVGGVTGTERYIRGNLQTGTFIGGASGSAGNFIGSAAGVNSLNALNGIIQGLGGNRQNQDVNNGNNGRGGRGGQTNREIPAKLVVGFTPPAPPSSVASAAIATRITRLPGIKTNGPIEVALEGRTAVLRGVVASEHDRDLLGRVILLEAGISKVENDLTVATPDQPSAETEAP